MAYSQSNASSELSISQKTREYKLYVDNLPQELNEDGIREVFNHYGKVVALFYRRNATWTYISYNTYYEAESALKDLNGVPPLHLKVSFAKEKNTSNACTKQQKVYNSENLDEYSDNFTQDFSYSNSSHTKVAGYGKPLNSIQPSLQSPMHKHVTDDASHPSPVDSSTYNPNENTRLFHNVNTLWTRGTITVRQDGKRHVSFGRGYTLYEIPNPHPKVEDNINKIYETRSTGLYEYGEDSLKSKVGKCQYCLKIAKMTCERCHIFYCNTTCQQMDWPRHKVECQTIPALVKAVDSTSLSRSSSEEQILTRDFCSTPQTLRKPKKFAEMHKTENTNPNVSHTNDDNNKTDCINQHFTRDTNNKAKINTEESFGVIRNGTDTTNISQLKTPKNDVHAKIPKTTELKLSDKRTQNKNIISNTALKMEEDLAFQKEKFLSKDKFMDVEIVLAAGNNEYWVHKVEEKRKFISFTDQLQHLAHTGTKFTKEEVIIGSMYGVLYKEFWCRAVILCLNPVRVHYIDYGNEELVPGVCEFKDIDIVKRIPVFASKIRLPRNEKYKHLDLKSVLSVRMISVDAQKVINVEVQEAGDSMKIYSNESLNIVNNTQRASEENGTVNSTNIPCAELKNGSEVLLTTYRSQYLLFVRSNDRNEVERYCDIAQRIAKCAQSAPRLKGPPDVGEMVIAPFKDGNYYRGVIRKIQNDNVWIIFVDFGNAEVISLSELRILPDELKKICACSAKIILKDVPQDAVMTKEVNDYLCHLLGTEIPLICTFNGIPSKDGVYLKTLQGESVNDDINHLLKPSWERGDRDDNRCYMLSDMTYVSLGEINQTVNACISFVLHEGHTYALYPCDPALINYVHDMMPALMKRYCESTDYYIPREEEICLALYEGNWYRGVCSNPRSTSTTAEILFIDYGNVENVNHKDIRLIPKDFISPEVIGIVCTITNLAPTDENGEYDPKVQKRISELLRPEEIITIKIREAVAPGVCEIELPRIRELLITEHLISAT